MARFLVFFDSIKDSQNAADRLRARMKPRFRDRILCFNADTSQDLRDRATKDYKDGKLIGLLCTDSFGMVRKTHITCSRCWH